MNGAGIGPLDGRPRQVKALKKARWRRPLHGFVFDSSLAQEICRNSIQFGEEFRGECHSHPVGACFSSPYGFSAVVGGCAAESFDKPESRRQCSIRDGNQTTPCDETAPLFLGK
ncbi:hypothetical protein A5653_17665 [Mycobacterium colombiense]|nr:hypothetical protein A5653_17665 [Mycobacterium colombiense]